MFFAVLQAYQHLQAVLAAGKPIVEETEQRDAIASSKEPQTLRTTSEPMEDRKTLQEQAPDGPPQVEEWNSMKEQAHDGHHDAHAQKCVQGRAEDGPPDVEVQSISQMFNNIGNEHGTPGIIPSREVGTVLQMMGVQLDLAQLYEAIRQLDSKGTGMVTLQDFLVWVQG
jgi:hypothetical protein